MRERLRRTNNWGTYLYQTASGKVLRAGMVVVVVWPDGHEAKYPTVQSMTMSMGVSDHGHYYPPAPQEIPVVAIEHHGLLVPIEIETLEAYLETEEP